MTKSMTRTEWICAAVVVGFFGPLLLLVLFLIANQFVSGHALDAVMFMSPSRGSSGSW